MKKKNLKTLKLTKKMISNLSSQKIGGRVAQSRAGGATCLVCPTYNGMSDCPTGAAVCEAQK